MFRRLWRLAWTDMSIGDRECCQRISLSCVTGAQVINCTIEIGGGAELPVCLILDHLKHGVVIAVVSAEVVQIDHIKLGLLSAEDADVRVRAALVGEDEEAAG